MKQWNITYNKVVNGKPLDRTDWQMLRFLVHRHIVFGKQKWLRDELLKKLYSCKQEELDTEMLFTIKNIEQQYIPHIGLNEKDGTACFVALEKRKSARRLR